MDADVIIAGAGPTGLTVATELALAGVRPIVVEALDVRSGQSKAMNLQPRTAELFDLRGLLPDAGEHAIGRIDGGHFAGVSLDYTALDTRYPYQMGVLQARVEELLEDRLGGLGGDLRRDWRLIGFEQDDEGVTVHGPETLRARCLVGCDGGRSTVRKLLGVAFPGTDATRWNTVADVILGAGTARPPAGWSSMGQARRRRPDGTFASVVPIGEPGLYRFVYSGGDADEPTTAEVTDRFHLFYGDEYELVDIPYASRFGNAARQAEKYRVGRVFLAGDAAHVHLPIGGQGLNTGVQDAFNLGWKLAAVLTGQVPDGLLDTYETERHPVGASVLANVRAQSAVQGPDPGNTALHDILTTLLALPDANRVTAGMISGLGVDYGGPGHVGTRLPDFRTGTGWASELFHTGHGVLLATREDHLAPALPYHGRIVSALVDALPWDDVEAVLVRPDGYVCAAAPGEDVKGPLRAWFGAAECSSANI
ncbi:FAD-dependent monooxygenase [Actinoallomurus bryophytorum]|uniref:2-polyprenyl-6-methoxyphenol hydroxylase-like FAD-dependent oxidoreductase n=1 Tax=Actinoallomurus bryophytorum TaxID=1490222 RepID=A0A543CMA7_9ACTN|nr:FAD-dependent monooxygenase [Actinoallomurus bryophytorum]TQL98229.1 2-polyprenyl-6-methoxyphenol hydroxylase-like FAD-dependent oxidoreductase [Actinoallomurus bryophytorum]